MNPSKKRVFGAVFLCLLAVVTMYHIGWLASLERVLRTILRPGTHALYTLRVELGDEAESFRSVEELQQTYREQKKVLLTQKDDAARLTLLLEENEALRTQLHFVTGTSFAFVGGDVIAKNIDALGNTIIINRGSEDGIAQNNPVIIGDGILIGKITAVSERESTVRLLNDSQSNIAATLLNKEKSMGIVEGGYGISVHMNFIPQHETIAIGDRIITSGLEKDMPRGLVIGTVEAVEKEAYQPFQRAVIAPAAKPQQATVVTVLLTHQSAAL